VGYESGDQQILKNIKKGATIERARQFTKDCHKLDWWCTEISSSACPRDSRDYQEQIKFAKELDVETIQVSVAHAFPGTELHESAIKNGFMTSDTKMVDDGGHQMVQIEYPGLPATEILEAVHHFYDEYYFRPKAAYRILRKAVFDNSERKRLYKEARTFLKLRGSATSGSGKTAKKKRLPRTSQGLSGETGVPSVQQSCSRGGRPALHPRRSQILSDLSQIPSPGGNHRIQHCG